MATPSEKLADSLQALHQLQASGNIAIRSSDLSRTHRERLLKNGFIEEVIRGGIFHHDLMKQLEKARLGMHLSGCFAPLI